MSRNEHSRGELTREFRCQTVKWVEDPILTQERAIRQRTELSQVARRKDILRKHGDWPSKLRRCFHDDEVTQYQSDWFVRTSTSSDVMLGGSAFAHFGYSRVSACTVGGAERQMTRALSFTLGSDPGFGLRLEADDQ